MKRGIFWIVSHLHLEDLIMGRPGAPRLTLTRLKLRNLPLVIQTTCSLSLFSLLLATLVFTRLSLASVLLRGRREWDSVCTWVRRLKRNSAQKCQVRDDRGNQCYQMTEPVQWSSLSSQGQSWWLHIHYENLYPLLLSTGIVDVQR